MHLIFEFELKKKCVHQTAYTLFYLKNQEQSKPQNSQPHNSQPLLASILKEVTQHLHTHTRYIIHYVAVTIFIQETCD